MGVGWGYKPISVGDRHKLLRTPAHARILPYWVLQTLLYLRPLIALRSLVDGEAQEKRLSEAAQKSVEETEILPIKKLSE